jgi:hypothetical protein
VKSKEFDTMKRAAEEELLKKGDEKRVLAAGGARLRGITKKTYARMVQAVEAAMVVDTKQPIVLRVEDRSTSNADHIYDYDLALVPSDRAAALHLLQRLELTQAREHEKLTQALYDNDEQWRSECCSTDKEARQKAKQDAQDRLMAECGVASVGHIDLLGDTDELSPFLYFQRCVAQFADDECDGDDDDGDESDIL